MKSLQILSGLALVVTIVLFTLHFTSGVDSFWFSVPLAVGITLNLISSIMLGRKRKQQERKSVEEIEINEE